MSSTSWKLDALMQQAPMSGTIPSRRPSSVARAIKREGRPHGRDRAQSEQGPELGGVHVQMAHRDGAELHDVDERAALT